MSRVVLSVTDAPLYRLVEVYRRMCRNMALSGGRSGALQAVLDRWLYGLEQQVVEVDKIAEDDKAFGAIVARRVRQSLAAVGERAGRLAACIEAYHAAQFGQQYAEARGILDWMTGESKVAASLKRSAGVTGQLDNADVMIFVRGLLELLRAAGWSGLALVLDETETTLRLKRPERQKSLEVLRQWVDAIDANEFPGLHLIVTGTPEFFDRPQGVPMLRLQQLAGLVGLRAFKWHGDVDAAHKRAFVDDPSEILMITPESLEVILATARYDKKERSSARCASLSSTKSTPLPGMTAATTSSRCSIA